MGELTPVLEADGRIIGNGKVGELTKRMQSLHLKHAIENGTSLPFKPTKLRFKIFFQVVTERLSFF